MPLGVNRPQELTDRRACKARGIDNIDSVNTIVEVRNSNGLRNFVNVTNSSNKAKFHAWTDFLNNVLINVDFQDR